jgi:general secretion pathway protein E
MDLSQDLLGLAQASGASDTPACFKAITEALQQQSSPVARLLDENLVEEGPFLEALSTWSGLPWQGQTIPVPACEQFPVRTALRHHLLPIIETNGTTSSLGILTYDPLNLLARQAVAQAIPGPVRWSMTTRRQIMQGLRQGYGIGAETFDQILEGRDEEVSSNFLRQETNVLDLDESEASVIKFVNQILREALQERATDIHVEPVENNLRIRYRIDGVLHEVPVPPRIKVLKDSVVSRLKVMANLDVAEKRMPQDGRINLELEGKPIDVRVSTLPSVDGESISLRLLGQEKFDFKKLGLDEKSSENIERLLAYPNGIILLTGPTGCGKSTSLYTFISRLNQKERRILTIEDPVEYKIPGVIQVQVKSDIKLDFATGLRSFLRGDPNVIMVGEMRDLETAQIAIRASQTGHLVFSTLHTNDSISGITRLIDMGVEPFLIASSVRVFIAQRLVRTLCSKCKQPAHYHEAELREIGFPLEWADTIQKVVGCDHCHGTGYKGRTAIYEICVLSPRLQELIMQKANANEMRNVALEEGMIPLRSYGWSKVAAGATTIEEVLSVTSADV